MCILLYCFHRIYDAGKTLLDFTNLFSPNDYKKIDKIICKYFQEKYVKSKKRWNKKLYLRLNKTQWFNKWKV